MKSIDTLVHDINEVIKGKGGWTEVINEQLKSDLGAITLNRLKSDKEERKPTLRMSNIGTPCKRKLWYSLHQKGDSEEPSASMLLMFMYGDILEALLLSLAEAAGHTVTGRQTVLDCYGIKGSRDAVIDGVTIDVKSASNTSMKKFVKHALRTDDTYGYIRQLAGYVQGGKDDPLVTDKTGGAFLAVNKQSGLIVLDYYNLTEELETMDVYIRDITATTQRGSELPVRGFEVSDFGQSGNTKLGFDCSICDFKKTCYPGLRTFQYEYGPVHLVDVVNEPRTPEIT